MVLKIQCSEIEVTIWFYSVFFKAWWIVENQKAFQMTALPLGWQNIPLNLKYTRSIDYLNMKLLSSSSKFHSVSDFLFFWIFILMTQNDSIGHNTSLKMNDLQWRSVFLQMHLWALEVFRSWTVLQVCSHLCANRQS